MGDFGLAKTQHEDSDNSSETRVVGTLGYLAPEYAECGKVSSKTDVYAFGVVLLQLITGLETTDKVLGGRSLVGWVTVPKLNFIIFLSGHKTINICIWKYLPIHFLDSNPLQKHDLAKEQQNFFQFFHFCFFQWESIWQEFHIQ